MKTKTFVGRMLPRARRPHLIALAALAAVVLACSMAVALWAAATGRGTLWAVSTALACAAALAARDCDRAAGGILSR